MVYALRGRYEVQAIDTEARDHATVLCREAAQEGYDVVVAFGGDGTVNEAANGLVGSDTPLFPPPRRADQRLLPDAGDPHGRRRRHRAPARLAHDWRPRRVDVGRVNARHFLFSAGVGLDASVVERVDAHPRLKARVGEYYYALQATRRSTAATSSTLPAWRPTSAARRWRASPPSSRTPSPTPTSATGRSTWARAPSSTAATWRAWCSSGPPRSRSRRSPGGRSPSGPVSSAIARCTRSRASTSLRVRSADERSLPLQVDGDYIGEVAEADFSVLPGGMLVVA